MSNKLTYEELERKVERLEKEVDDRKRTERELQEERDRAQRYLEIAGVILVVLNSDQTVQLINRKGCDVLGYEPVQIVGRNWFDSFCARKGQGANKGRFC